MSKFIERLKQLSEGAPQPIGFRTNATAASKPKIQLVASISEKGFSADALKGADAALVNVQASQKENETWNPDDKPAIPYGLYVAGDIDAKSLEKAGADFVVFSTGEPIDPLVDTKPGKIIQVDAASSDSALRSLNAIPVDAILVPAISHDAMTWQDLMTIRRIASLVDKPIIVAAPPALTEATLKTLWETGVDAVVVDVTAEKAPDLPALRKMIDGMDRPAPKRRPRGVPSVPRLSLEPEQQEDEEEEDE